MHVCVSNNLTVCVVFLLKNRTYCISFVPGLPGTKGEKGDIGIGIAGENGLPGPPGRKSQNVKSYLEQLRSALLMFLLQHSIIM